MLLPLAAQASRRAGSGSHAVRFGFARRLSSRSGGRRHSPHGGYGHDVLGDNAGFRPIQSSAAEGIEGIVNHGATSVDSFSSSGFVINGISLAGPVLLLPEQSFMFSPASLQSLTPESLDPLLLLKEKTELLIIGCGTRIEPLPVDVSGWASRHSIVPEILATRIACSTFNFMVQEQRLVAAVLFPPGSESHGRS